MRVVTDVKPGSTYGEIAESMMKSVLASGEPVYAILAGVVIFCAKDGPKIEVVQDMFGLDPKGGVGQS